MAILGPLEIQHDGLPVEVGGARLRSLLVRMALDAGRPVAAAALADAVWDDAPPRDELHALHSLVSRLRRALGDPALLIQDAAGYRLALAAPDVDALRFEQLARVGSAALQRGDALAAARTLAEALALWRGPALGDLSTAGRFAVAAAGRLEDLRVAARVDRLAAEAQLGGAAPLVAELEGLAADDPLNERVAALLVAALAAVGRQADALGAYERVRTLLDEELGVVPSAELQAAHLAVVRGDGEPVRPVPGASNLPAARTSFIGREADVARAGGLLERSRLVTLIGPGGAGKTRLASVIAEAWTGRVRDGTWLVELAAVGDAAAIAPALLGSLGLREAQILERRGTMSPGDAEGHLLDVLAGADALLVLDNCEHLIVPVAQLADRLLAACPALRILATSREPLGIGGESLAPVAPLGVPEGDVGPQEAMGHPAIALFADRASAASPGFAVDARTVAAVVDVCRRIDGLPLAIELAAARLRSMPLDQLAARLHDRFRLLTGGSRAAMGRQRTLRAVVDWSWDLLGEPERRLARRLAVFPAGATLDAVEAVCAGDGVERDDVFDLLCSLVDRSLLQIADPEGPRWRMLETIREYGIEQAEEAGELAGLRAAHARYFSSVVAEADRHLRTAEQLVWLARLAVERDNVLAALRFAGERGDAATALRMVVGLLWFWVLTGGRQEVVTWGHFALGVEGEADPLDRVLIGGVLGWADIENADGSRWEVPEEAIALVEHADLHDRPLLAACRAVLAFLAREHDRAGQMIEASARHPDPWVRATAPFTRAQVAENSGDLDAMRVHLEEALALFRAAGDRWGTAVALSELASQRMLQGDLAGAETALAETAGLLDELGSGRDGAMLFMRRADLRARQGDREGARELLREAMDRHDRSSQETMILTIALAAVTACLGDLQAARDLRLAAIEELQRSPPVPVERAHQRALVHGVAVRVAALEGDLAAARQHLDEAWDAAIGTEDSPIVGLVGLGTATLAHLAGRHRLATEMVGAAARMRGTEDPTNPDLADLTTALRAALGDAQYEPLVAAGRALDAEAATARLDPAVLDLPSVGPEGEGDEDDEQDRHPDQRPQQV